MNVFGLNRFISARGYSSLSWTGSLKSCGPWSRSAWRFCAAVFSLLSLVLSRLGLLCWFENWSLLLCAFVRLGCFVDEFVTSITFRRSAIGGHWWPFGLVVTSTISRWLSVLVLVVYKDRILYVPNLGSHFVDIEWGSRFGQVWVLATMFVKSVNAY